MSNLDSDEMQQALDLIINGKEEAGSDNLDWLDQKPSAVTDRLPNQNEKIRAAPEILPQEITAIQSNSRNYLLDILKSIKDAPKFVLVATVLMFMLCLGATAAGLVWVQKKLGLGKISGR